MPQRKKPIEIDSVEALIEELSHIAPEGMVPGFYSEIAINNANIWRIVKELKELKNAASWANAHLRPCFRIEENNG